MLHQHQHYLQTYKKHKLSEHPRSLNLREWSDLCMKNWRTTDSLFLLPSLIWKRKSVSFLSNGDDDDAYLSETCAKCTTSSQHSLSLYNRYIMTCYCSREPDHCSLLLYTHSLKQTNVISLILIDVYLYWATLRLQKTVLSLRQTLVLRGRHAAHQNKPVRKATENSQQRKPHQSLGHIESVAYELWHH